MASHTSLEAILEGFRHIEMNRYTKLASTSIILFDHALTFGGEVEYIWKANWTAGKVMFLINRYYSVFSAIFNTVGFFNNNLTNDYCRMFLQWQGWTGLLSCAITEIILQMRIYAMYSMNKIVLAVMLVSFTASITGSGYVMGTVLAMITPTAVTIPGAYNTFCVPVGIPVDYFYLFWIPMLLFELLICGLALARGYKTFVGKGPVLSTGRRLVIVLFRDSVVYFIAICAIYLTCLLMWLYAPITLLQVPITFTVAVSCVFGNRIILNVRKLGARSRVSVSTHQGHHQWTSQGGPTSSTHAATNVSFAYDGVLSRYEMDKLRELRSTSTPLRPLGAGVAKAVVPLARR